MLRQSAFSKWMCAPTCLISATLLLLGLASSVRAAEPAPGLDFTRDVKPILSNNCFHCHGPDAKERKGGADGLRLDTAEGMAADLGEGRVAVKKGDVSKSELIARVTSTDADLRMPPASTGKKLSKKEIGILTEWVKQGAPFSKHWSYTKPQRPKLPVVKETAWGRNAIDRFLLARLEREGLKPAAEADRYALIRRVSLDLTGLPPSWREVTEFIDDKSPDAYEKLVDRLLAKPTYGEHWARMWLDLARYADSAGYADDPSRVIWSYRDYVIRAFNANRPFDQFTIEQIAGDLLPQPSQEQLIATAFHRNTLTNNEGGTNDEEFRNVAVVDRVNTTFAVWMGTTMACAQCHNHKYDPISQEEFFRVFAIFNQSEDADKKDESPLLTYFTPEQVAERAKLQTALDTEKGALRQFTPELTAAKAKWEAAFPRDLAWRTLLPAKIDAGKGAEATVADEGRVEVLKGGDAATYTLEIPVPAGKWNALQLETLPHEKLPGKGAGLGKGGSFAIAKVTATLHPRDAATGPTGRFVRVEIPGKGKMLSLAEVQVLRAGENLALKGKASQSSTDYGGDAARAIDGKTDGRYVEGASVTHTAVSDSPWWEVDLQTASAIDTVQIWGRTDASTVDRLKDFTVSLLDAERKPVWKTSVAQPPKPSVTLSPTGVQSLTFDTAVADATESGFDANTLIVGKEGKAKDPKAKGWSPGTTTNVPHAVTFIRNQPFEVAEGSTLKLVIEHPAMPKGAHLGHFRFKVSADAGALEWAKTPRDVIAALQTPAGSRSSAELARIDAHFLAIAPELAPQRRRVEALEQQLRDIQAVTVPIMRELAADKLRKTQLQHRGNFLDLGQEVQPGVPSAWNAFAANEPVNRLALAKWLVSADNPLTARVVANRYWEQIFGIGIVSSSEEFGAQGDLPEHPELLDWLATELVQSGWDTKAFLKLLVTSAAYRQSTKVTPDLAQRDPDNRLLARGPRFRLSAETVRDQALAVGGLLSAKMYGPPVKPLQPSSGLSAAFGSGIDWKTSDGEDKYRRGLYTTWRRSNPYPSMAAFDAPNREVCTVRRSRTNTPLQALVTLNDPVYVEAAQALARRIVKVAAAADVDERVRFAVRETLARAPHDAELSRLRQLHARALEAFRQQPEQAKKMATDPLGMPDDKSTDLADLAAWTVLSNVLLNLDETIMKR